MVRCRGTCCSIVSKHGVWGVASSVRYEDRVSSPLSSYLQCNLKLITSNHALVFMTIFCSKLVRKFDCQTFADMKQSPGNLLLYYHGDNACAVDRTNHTEKFHSFGSDKKSRHPLSIASKAD